MKNTVTLVGFVGNNPEVRTTQSGAAITSISLATSRNFKDSEGNRQTETKWHRITCFNGVGKCVAEHVTMGAMVIHLIRTANPHAWDEISQGARIVETNREAIKRCTN
jgi:single stranded DNA-binding protein